MQHLRELRGPASHVICGCVAVLAACACSSTGSSKATTSTTTVTRPASRHTIRPAVATSSTTNPPVTTTTPTTKNPNFGSTTIAASIAPSRTTAESEISDAVRVVRAMGYTPRDTDDFTYPDFSFGLHVIIGVATGSGTGYTQRAFFFVHHRYIGADATYPSATIQTVWRTDSTIAIGYTIYKTDDPMCCPLGGAATVRYHWNGTRLIALDPIPSFDARR
jgi:LppP/LprE lipoprotein